MSNITKHRTQGGQFFKNTQEGGRSVDTACQAAIPQNSKQFCRCGVCHAQIAGRSLLEAGGAHKGR